MHVAVRTDASLAIGTGHVMRCLTLAKMLHKRGAEVFFVCREHDGHLCDLIQEQGFAVSRLSARTEVNASWQEDAAASRVAIEMQGGRADLLVVDHYGLDARWERVLRPMVGRVFVIDDLADRPHDCDVLLDQNLHDAPESRYSALVPASIRLFIGPRFALLRPEFDAITVRLRDRGLQRLLVFLGGTDPSNEVLKLVSALRGLGADAPLTKIVLGPTNPHAAAVRHAAQGMDNVNIIGATSQMASLMDEADLGIGTCGGAAWERCALGLPALVVVNAENQRDDARILHAMGAVRNLGDAAATSVERWIAEIRALQRDPVALKDMSASAAAVMQDRKQAMRDLEAALVS